MKLIILAFIISLTLHFLIISNVNKKEKVTKNNNLSKIEKKEKQSIRYVRILQKPIVKTKAKKKIIKKSQEKKVNKKVNTKIYKKVEKKKIIPQKKKKVVKKSKKVIPKAKIKSIVKPILKKKLVKKTEIKPQEKRKTISKKSLENFLLSDLVPLNKNMLDDITKSYLNLYGEEYNSFTKVQKVYLQKNLKNIGRITQRYLRYPLIAVKTKQQGMNIVEFFLHPNGDISHLKLINSSGYSSLDKNSIETIEIAYKDYPRPKTKTKIKIYVYYKLY